MAQIAQFPGLGMYDEGGKFEVKQEFIDEARAKAIEEGKKYYGDATNFEVFKDSVLNLPDAAINFVARGAEGTGELVAGIASLAMKGGQLATTTDPDKLTQIMSEPSFTKYMGAFRDKIPTGNLYESDISGIEDTEKAFGTAAYYTSPVPMAPFAKGAAQVAKGLASTNIGKNIADELGTAATYFPRYTPFKKIEPKSVGAMSIDELIESNQLKKASEMTDDPLNLMAIERDRFQKLVEAKRKRGKVFEVGQEGTEGTFRYRGNTYNKADGVLIGYPGKRRDFEKNWIPKEVIGKPDVIAKQPSIDVKIKAQKKAVETKRMKNINEYYPNLQKEMLENNLMIDEAVVKLAGRDLPKGTKSYQITDKFYRLSDDMKNVNPKMHQFFENEIKAYQIQNYLKGTRKGDKFKGEKIRFGTKEYEAARKELAEKLNIDVKFIDRAHSIMKSRLKKLSKLVDEGTITNEQAMKLSKPQYFLLNSDNLTHVKLENKLDTLLQRKKNYLDEKDFTSANKVQEGIGDITKQMEELGVESELFDPVKKLIKVFGRRPETVEIYKKAKKSGIKKKDGGLVGISHLTRPL